ncbi:hypothetical protein H072_8123 [Dactylellina haptotyla CBS 200.50]|uniref:Peptidase S33 tripeptidyl aminopeptidase-like C-terminal domain-containing protein n=1 Tax=Dactylellina haptotyla (strain CBS 200.50) TaxID=1284197 RepID=S8BFP1_DACHA|nr:hypothetical protein H072_8123 [Dactylellina haptotyla CBS 200.50]
MPLVLEPSLLTKRQNPIRGVREKLFNGVPLDYNKPENGLQSIIPVIKAPAAKGFPYKGTVMFNPGGPGALGTEYLYKPKAVAKLRSRIIGDGWDIVSFDPRGFGYSVPFASCGVNPRTIELDRANATTSTEKPKNRLPRRLNRRARRPVRFNFRNSTSNPSNAYDQSFGMNVARDPPSWKGSTLESALDLSSSCLNLTSQYNQAGPHMNTVVVATDMLSIGKALAREKGEPEDNVMVNFYGISYGTVIGQWFASLYPKNVGKIMLDGVVDSASWIAKREENTTTLHVDEGWARFFPRCHQAGPQNCSFATGNSTEAIRDRFNIIMTKLDATKYQQENNTAASLVGDALSGTKEFILSSLYDPHDKWPILADYLTAMEPLIAPVDPNEWDATGLMELLSSNSTVKRKKNEKPVPRPALETLTESFLSSKIACTKWPVRPAWEWFGPIGGETATPILFAGNLLDPITPYENARKATSLFKGAKMIYVDEVGHSTLSTKNKCAFNHAINYFQEGKLPSANTRCKSEQQPFQ